MKSTLRYIQFFLLLLLSTSCRDGVIIDGKMFGHTGFAASKPAPLIHKGLLDHAYGYTEISFQAPGLENSDRTRDEISVFMRYRKVGSSHKGYGCSVEKDGAGSNQVVVARSNEAHSSSEKINLATSPPLDVTFNEPHRLGCEIVRANGSDWIHAYLNETLIVSYDLGATPDHTSGAVGFRINDESEQVYSISTFKFYLEKPY